MPTEPPPAAPDANPPKLRGLWGVMQPDAPVEQAISSTEPSAQEPSTAETAAVAEENPSAPKGLWGVMQTSAAVESVAAQHAPIVDESTPAAEPAAADVNHPSPKSLWELMRADVAEAVIENVESPEATVLEPDADPIDEAEEPALVSPLGRPARFAVPRSVPLDAKAPLLPLICGASAVPLAALAYFPGLWMSVPAALGGFVAVLTAVGIGIERNSASRRKLLAALAGGLGLMGVLAGPLVFTPLGNQHRESASPRITELHLRKIGTGLDRFHQERATFPVGGTTIRDADGRERGGHGWLTALLPFVDANDVYLRIDLALPFEDPANRAALSTPIEMYFAAGGNREPLPSGFAVSHFAGVGGEVTNARGEVLAAGVLTQNRAIGRDEVRDGLSQTLVAGEIPGGYPPWGDPGNFRTTGRGLNREPRGFGNAAGTGATMLFADGSVRFFSNRTDPELLRRLSTRDGSDGVGR
jgi:prepilin-type processing-associated H-X9-DG protein